MTFQSWRHVVIFSLAVTVGFAALPVVFADDQSPEKEVDAATKQLIAAHGLFERGLFKLAADDYVAFLEKNPKHAEAVTARYALAICHYRLSRFEEAAKQLTVVLADDKFKQRDEALAVLGHCQLTLKDHTKALAAFDEILAKHGTSKFAEGAALNRAQVLYMLDRKADALSACKAFLEKHPKSPFQSNALYTLALTQHSLAQFADAEKSLTDLLTNTPNSPYSIDATLLLGQCQESLGKLDDAAINFRKMIERAPGARQAEGLYRLAVVLHNSGKHAEAIKQLQTILADHSQSTFAGPARLQLGKTQYDANDLSAARKTLEGVVKNDKERADEASFWLAQCDISDRKYDTALKTLDALGSRTNAPANIEDVEFFRAVCRMQLEQFDAAGKAFEAFRGRFAKSSRATESMHHQAFCLHKLEKYDESRKLCEMVVNANDPTWTFAANKLWAENLFLSQAYGPAAEKYAQLAPLAKSDEDKLQIDSRIAQAAYFAGDFKKAAELLAPLSKNEAVTKQSELRRVIFLHGDALLQTGDFKNASDPLTRYLKLVPADEEARYKLGLAQQRAGDDDAALATYAMAMAGKTESTWVQHALLAFGQVAYRKKQPDKAEPALKKVVSAKAGESLLAPALYLLAWIDFDAKKYEDAAVAFGEMVKQFPKHELAADAMFQRGVCLSEAGKTEPALTALNEYVAANPKGKQVAQARQLIGASLAKLGKHDEAVKMLATLAADTEGRTDVVLYDLAWSQRTLKQNDAAIQSYQQLLTEFKESKLITPVRVELAELLYAKEQYKAAAELIETALQDNSGDAKTLTAGRYRLGWCYAKLNEHAKAAAAFGAFIAASPKDSLVTSALYQSGMALRSAGNLAEAQKQFAALITQFPKDELASTAMLRLGETQAEAGQYAESAKSYQQFADGYPKSEFIHLAYFGIGWASEQQKQYDTARSWYAKTIDKTNTETAARAQFQIGETHFAQKNFELAAKELLKVEIVYAYPSWSAKALYEAGQAFEQLDQIDDARAQYERCVQNYAKEPAAELSKKRLDAIKTAGR